MLITIAAVFGLSQMFARDNPPANELPQAWHGTWRGTLVIVGATDKPTEVPLTLKIEPIAGTNQLAWVATYAGKKEVVKEYKLVPVKDKPGRFHIDEGNGILLDTRFANNTLYSQFEVAGALLTARYELRGDSLLFEVTSAKPSAEKTGNGKIQTYTLEAVQTATLKKK